MAWNVYYPHSSSTLLFSMPNPGEAEVNFESVANVKQIDLADGSTAFLTQSTTTKYNPVTFKLTFANEPSTITTAETNILSAISNKYKVKLTTHEGQSITGKFSKVGRVYKLSGKTQRYDLNVEFLRDS